MLTSLEQTLRRPEGFASYEALRQWMAQPHHVQVSYKLRLRGAFQLLQGWEYRSMPFETEAPLEFVDANTAIVSLPFQHTKNDEAAGHMV
jgi:hypothetical protein